MIVRADRVLCAEATDAKPRCVSINDGIIREISEDAPVSEGEEVLDFTGHTITPCFCDHHLHFPLSESSAIDAITGMLLRSGIKKVLDGGERQGTGLQIKKNLAGKIDILTAGQALYKQGGYGGYIGRPIGDITQARDVIHELSSLGIDYLKVIQSGVYDPDSDCITAGGFPADELKEIVACARGLGLDIYCHANGETAVREAADAGVSAIIHGLHVTHETLSAMTERKIVFIPTVHAFRSLRMHAKSDSARMNIDRAVDGHLSAVNAASERRVTLLSGSDSGPKFLPYGDAYISELQMFQSAGIPYESILRLAAVSTLRPGMIADFVLLDGLTVKGVVRDGKIIS